jgi:hypothetical protein
MDPDLADTGQWRLWLIRAVGAFDDPASRLDLTFGQPVSGPTRY